MRCARAGDALLVSPILRRGAVSTKAYFPQGLWYSLYDHSLVNATAGGRNATVTVCTSLSRCLTSSWQSCCASCLLARGEQGFASMVHTAKLQHSCCYLWVGTMQVLTHTRHVYNL